MKGLWLVVWGLAAVAVVGTADVKWAPTKCGPGNLMTSWGKTVDPSRSVPLAEYPRPQMSREAQNNTWVVLNGLWEWEESSEAGRSNPPYGRTLKGGNVLVPFPIESCLSGVGKTMKYLYYRRTLQLPAGWLDTGRTVLLHFGAVDWRCTVHVDGSVVGSHEGMSDPFSFDITSFLDRSRTAHEVLVWVFDPSDDGYQVNGKQRISAITNPEGDTYTPATGIWQTVWLEAVPTASRIADLRIVPSTKGVSVIVETAPASAGRPVHLTAKDAAGAVVATASGVSGSPLYLAPANPRLWSPDDPYLYSLRVELADGTDAVDSYFALREFYLMDVKHPGTTDRVLFNIDCPGQDLGNPTVLPKDDYTLCWKLCNETAACKAWAYGVQSSTCEPKQPTCWLKGSIPATTQNTCRICGIKGVPAGLVKRPALNGKPIFLNGWLDQSYWPDGIFTAPTDEALAFDLKAVKTFGYNTVRLHQKVNSERWYWYADKLGVIVIQDQPQKYGHASAATVPPFKDDLIRLIEGKSNHPCIVQWTAFNEDDCWTVFDVPAIVGLIRTLDPIRPIDTDSGGGANNLYIGDVNDIHTYPWPGDPLPSATQYGMIGEYGGLGAFISGHEWVPGKCYAYMGSKDPEEMTQQYLKMVSMVKQNIADVSALIYTQITDVERECDGFYTYDRLNKLNTDQLQRVAAANKDLINTPLPL